MFLLSFYNLAFCYFIDSLLCFCNDVYMIDDDCLFNDIDGILWCDDYEFWCFVISRLDDMLWFWGTLIGLILSILKLLKSPVSNEKLFFLLFIVCNDFVSPLPILIYLCLNSIFLLFFYFTIFYYWYFSIEIITMLCY